MKLHLYLPKLWQLKSAYRKMRRNVQRFFLQSRSRAASGVPGAFGHTEADLASRPVGMPAGTPSAPHLGFWATMRERSLREGRPVYALAPMADVTDAPFRRLIAALSRMQDADGGGGGPDIMWTEFVSADGLFLGGGAGRHALLRDLIFTPAERPLVAQFFTSRPETMYQAALLATELGFEGIDINMGCPDKSIEKQGAGASMIKTPDNARAVLRAALDGARDGAVKYHRSGGPLPVSVKTRLGYHRDELETWLPQLLMEGPAAITVHARTRRELSLVPARWARIGKAVVIRDTVQASLAPHERTLILGNGDIQDTAQGALIRNQEAPGAEGVMIGRGVFGNPWLFDRKRTEVPSLSERLTTLVQHAALFEDILGGEKNFAVMKKHFKAYVHGFDGAKELRIELMNTTTAAEVRTLIEEWLASHT